MRSYVHIRNCSHDMCFKAAILEQKCTVITQLQSVAEWRAVREQQDKESLKKDQEKVNPGYQNV